eukprot:CAMPEP_0202921800 /NCGR_PEP_ID=MMETSP1392-20130828/77589_1 /ASSEMBLY_ACC=CAM_ASM_000868 /TAXON_ID=225041 /ORGANISM="Chlamydomonas chlamydogama, Strain SAG 11-48b" /LENGTH=94 /DNA_ID=CAMNT_0049615397 /DNA_START=314 /DNA_END=598 /DNA_ORIENTATION=+
MTCTTCTACYFMYCMMHADVLLGAAAQGWSIIEQGHMRVGMCQHQLLQDCTTLVSCPVVKQQAPPRLAAQINYLCLQGGAPNIVHPQLQGARLV